ncbi:hypothetical protein BCR33DRAFT_719600 [Rhizoclosmatium globosum]|uniref:Uncharacterized protein n=1 Tax=Rhizoclosmatium globosum TaxID=329046 RepID=A0A1Y2BZM1_9FUNG|nr:hypothetical protein BCR33DRAFT_719600 [Rhizoclosmatium globosum]|eukprot:ORY40243.1 hypothetical protein BCR33DRAFT_719600 [Rhizoclosmatium globosum]
MSPCGTYVVTGSEDKQAVLYDVRMGGGVLGRMKEGIKEGVLAVGFGSSRGVVGVGCADGKCLVYKV